MRPFYGVIFFYGVASHLIRPRAPVQLRAWSQMKAAVRLCRFRPRRDESCRNWHCRLLVNMIVIWVLTRALMPSWHSLQAPGPSMHTESHHTALPDTRMLHPTVQASAAGTCCIPLLLVLHTRRRCKTESTCWRPDPGVEPGPSRIRSSDRIHSATQA